MSFAPNSLFFGKINDTNPNELLKKIDYSKNNLEDRKQVVNELLNSGFYEGYFEEYFKVNINSGDYLSEHDNACSSLEKMANYLLNSAEVKEDKKETEYIFYTDEEAFKKAVYKEGYLDGINQGPEQENVIHFLKKENRNFKKDKTQTVKNSDYHRGDFLSEVLWSYRDYLAAVTTELNNYEESKLSRYKLSEISGAVKRDMIMSKDIILGTFGYKTNAEESTIVDWGFCDLKNPDHVRAMLYMKPGHRSDEELMYLVDEFVEKLITARPTKLQREIVLLMRANKGPTEIGEELEISKQRVDKNIKMLVTRICKL
ncbi:MAG TPA: hypothetical protein VK190_04940 [Pseudoneobacillus sp.]|nr:hypothetical protein [Pseudoneobacillus sp.]